MKYLTTHVNFKYINRSPRVLFIDFLLLVRFNTKTGLTFEIVVPPYSIPFVIVMA